MRGRAGQPNDPNAAGPITPFLIGPGLDPTQPTPTTPTADPARDLLEDARLKVRCENEEEEQTIALTRRLVIAFVLIILIGAVFFILMPYYGMNLPPIMPLMVFIAIAAGALLTAPKAPKKKRCADDDGRAIGCCQGPRPLRSFRDKD
ncbi:MAG: hypothetical protein ACI89L_000481 [Phycisphaerales bacterium]|jgi:hypothetical protein